MILDFVHLSRAGQVIVDVRANTDPPALGGDENNLGFAACTATVHYEGEGYLSMMGWVQLVRSTDAGSSTFEIDPYLLFPDVDSPYAFYGSKPTLFDGPGREHRQDMDWLAHSFLAVTPVEYRAREVRSIVGFSWGFTIREAVIDVVPPAELPLAAWDDHIPFLQAEYPGWRFKPNARKP